MRTILDMPQDQLQALDALCRQAGLSRAEAVRRAVREYLKRRTSERREDAFGMWRGRVHDGLSYEASLLRDWDAVE